MGTRCSIHVLGDNDVPVLSLYRHNDGMPEVTGREIWEFASTHPYGPLEGYEAQEKNGFDKRAGSRSMEEFGLNLLLGIVEKRHPGTFYCLMPAAIREMDGEKMDFEEKKAWLANQAARHGPCEYDYILYERDGQINLAVLEPPSLHTDFDVYNAPKDRDWWAETEKEVKTRKAKCLFEGNMKEFGNYLESLEEEFDVRP